MRNFPPDSTPSVGLRNRRPARVDPVDSTEFNPPAPLQMFTRLSVMLMVALCFGLAAQFLVGMPPH